MYKYNILNRINKLPYALGRKFKKEVHLQLGVDKITFKKWCYIKEGCTLEIRSNCLIMIAEFFNVHPRELYTTPPKKLIITHELITQQTSILDYDNDTKVQ